MKRQILLPDFSCGEGLIAQRIANAKAVKVFYIGIDVDPEAVWKRGSMTLMIKIPVHCR